MAVIANGARTGKAALLPLKPGSRTDGQIKGVKMPERRCDRVSADPNFGGFIFRSEPEPHAIVMFTGDAEARLRHYTRDPRFRAQIVDITLAELERMKDRVSQQPIDPRIRCLSVDADEEHNSVTLSAPPNGLEMVRAAIADGRFKPPPKLRLEARGCVELR